MVVLQTPEDKNARATFGIWNVVETCPSSRRQEKSVARDGVPPHINMKTTSFGTTTRSQSSVPVSRARAASAVTIEIRWNWRRRRWCFSDFLAWYLGTLESLLGSRFDVSLHRVFQSNNPRFDSWDLRSPVSWIVCKEFQWNDSLDRQQLCVCSACVA